jgi:lipoate-protein ligase A
VSIEPYAHDDALCDAAREQGRALGRVYRVDTPLVVLGRGSKAELELDLAACEADGAEVRRRRGGGCSVVLDPGNVIVSAAAPLSGFADNKRLIEGFTDWIIFGLAALGYDSLTRRGVSDIVWRERKVSGSCLHRPRGLCYYSASLLVDADLALLDRYLRHPPREPSYRGGRDHGSFVGSLVSGRYATAKDLAPALEAQLVHGERGRRKLAEVLLS